MKEEVKNIRYPPGAKAKDKRAVPSGCERKRTSKNAYQR